MSALRAGLRGSKFHQKYRLRGYEKSGSATPPRQQPSIWDYHPEAKLISSALDLPSRETNAADLQLFKSPLAEWVMRQFLLALDHLLKRGLRFDYLRVEEEKSFLRGQLDMAKQMRQPPGRQHLFHLRHDLFLPDRPENRLLRLALNKDCQAAQEANNWRLAHELAGFIHEIPPSRDVRQDFACWRTDRLMAHYQAVRSWCELILGSSRLSGEGRLDFQKKVF